MSRSILCIIVITLLSFIGYQVYTQGATTIIANKVQADEVIQIQRRYEDINNRTIFTPPELPNYVCFYQTLATPVMCYNKR